MSNFARISVSSKTCRQIYYGTVLSYMSQNVYFPFLSFNFIYNIRFQYKFEAEESGSMFYHSHLSFQRGDGLFGPYIVRTIKEQDPNSKEYDFDLTEHFISVQEWFHKVKHY